MVYGKVFIDSKVELPRHGNVTLNIQFAFTYCIIRFAEIIRHHFWPDITSTNQLIMTLYQIFKKDILPNANFHHLYLIGYIIKTTDGQYLENIIVRYLYIVLRCCFGQTGGTLQLGFTYITA